MKTLALLLSCMLVAACTTARATDPNVAAVGARIHAAWNEHIRAAKARDLPGVMALYTDDAVYAIADNPLRRGRAELEAMEQQGMASNEVLAATHTTQSLRVLGDHAFELGNIEGDVAANGQPAQHVVFHYVAEWRAAPDGAWRIAHLVGRMAPR